MNFMRVRHDVISRGEKAVIHSGVLTIPLQSTTGLVGINGAGKSTLLLAMSEMLSGTMTSTTSERTVLRSIAIAPQSPRFPEWLTAREVALVYGVPWSALAQFDGLMLNEIRDTRVSRMSAGQAQILNVALALVSGALIILLDEPFAALDFRRRIALARILAKGVSTPDGTRSAIVVASPSVGDIVETCSWIVVIASGRYAVNGPIEDLLDGGKSKQTKQHQIEQRLMSILDPVTAPV